MKIDYLENDFAACVASGGIIKNLVLYYGFMTDCGVCVFNKKGKLKFRTKDEGPNKKIGKQIAKDKKYGKGWRNPEWRVRTRSHYRNNPKEPLAYGALTGEKSALHYLRTGKVKLELGDFIIFYTNGISPIIFPKRFDITKHFGDLENYIEKQSNKIGGSEGTLVAIFL